jgi:AraC-like DNA-binding protein
MDFNQLFDKGCHLACRYYDSVEYPIIEEFNPQAGNVAAYTATSITIVFLMKGKISLSCGFAVDKPVSMGNIFILPKGENYTIRYLEESRILFFHIQDDNELCIRLKDYLHKFHIKNEDKCCDGMTLKINMPIQSILDTFRLNFEEGMKCQIYLHTVIDQLLMVICSYYPPEDVAKFFLPAFSRDTLFRMTVIRQKDSFFKENKLAALFNMSPSAFYKNFRQAFGTSPKTWIKEERKKKILSELRTTDRSLSEISYECGFSSPAQFYKFCKNELGNTPTSIRNDK